MNCLEARRLIFDDGPAPHDHLRACDGCRTLDESLRRVDELLRAEPMLEPPNDLAARVMAAVARPTFSARRELWKIAAAVAVALGLTAVSYSTLRSEVDKQKRWAPVVKSGFQSAVNLTETKIKEAKP